MKEPPAIPKRFGMAGGFLRRFYARSALFVFYSTTPSLKMEISR